MYHGTDIKTGNNIIASQEMLPSRGDHHWLGNGVYFYKDAVYAFRWIAIKYTDNFKRFRDKDYQNIFNEYSILEADINSDKVFDLDDIQTRLFFIKVKNTLLKKSKHSIRMQKEIDENKVADGVVFNVLFEKMGYKDKFDIVQATFPISYLYDTSSRMDFLPEPQICVKNTNIIKNIRKYDKVEDIPEYAKFLDLYRNTKKRMLSLPGKRTKYSNRNSTKGPSYYKKGGRQNGF